MSDKLLQLRTKIFTPSLSAILLRSVAAAACGGLLFGFDIVVISGTNGPLRETFKLSEWWLGITNSSAIWAAIPGTLASGFIADRVGRCDGLRIAGWLFMICAIGCALAWDLGALILFRAFGGFAVGMAAVICPMYIAEISPAKWRGRLVCLFQFNIVFGILLAYLSNAIISRLHPGVSQWRWKFGAEVVPNLLFLSTLAGIPESPRWLAKKGQEAKARGNLAKLGEADLDARMQDIHRSLAGVQGDRLFQTKYYKPILLGFLLATFNNMAGINAVLYYLNDMFHKAGFGAAASDNSAVIVGFTNMIFTVAAFFLIDRLGRKSLLLIGSALMTPCLAGIAMIFRFQQHQQWLLWIVGAYIASFAISQGAVIWVYLSEIVPNSIRGKGEALSGFVAMVEGALITLLVPPLFEKIGFAGTYWAFAIATATGFFVVLFYFPETKGITLEELQRRLEGRESAGICLPTGEETQTK